ncbi:MAG: UbiA family prenyltransferase [Deltaproteobacteria bacterium]|nr:UbiA family prenyltransferase [Deltaproteobacteria bacterium]
MGLAHRVALLSGAWTQHFLQGAAEVVLRSSLWLAASLGSMTLFAGHFLGLEVGAAPAVLVFASSLFIYNLDHAADAENETLSAQERAFFRGESLHTLIGCSGLATAILVLAAPPAARLVFCSYLAVGVVYGIPLLPVRGGDGWRLARLKEIPGSKAWITAGALTLATVGLPVAYAGRGLGLDGALLFLFLFTCAASGANICDIRDLEDDRSTGVLTLPIQLGVSGAKVVLAVLNGVALLVLIGGTLSGASGAHPEVVPIIMGTLMILRWVRSDTNSELFSLVVHGTYCLFAPLAMLHLFFHG